MCSSLLIPMVQLNNVKAATHVINGTDLGSNVWISDYFKIKNCDYVMCDIYCCSDYGTISQSEGYGGSTGRGTLYLLDMAGSTVASVDYAARDTDGACGSDTINLSVPANLRNDNGYYAIKLVGNYTQIKKYIGYVKARDASTSFKYHKMIETPDFDGFLSSGNLTRPCAYIVFV